MTSQAQLSSSLCSDADSWQPAPPTTAGGDADSWLLAPRTTAGGDADSWQLAPRTTAGGDADSWQQLRTPRGLERAAAPTRSEGTPTETEAGGGVECGASGYECLPMPPMTPPPVVSPQAVPTHAVSPAPTVSPTAVPTHTVSPAPAVSPQAVPTHAVSPAPAVSPTAVPTHAVSPAPTVSPQAVPTHAVSPAPAASPTAVPTHAVSPTTAVSPQAVPAESPTPVVFAQTTSAHAGSPLPASPHAAPPLSVLPTSPTRPEPGVEAVQEGCDTLLVRQQQQFGGRGCGGNVALLQSQHSTQSIPRTSLPPAMECDRVSSGAGLGTVRLVGGKVLTGSACGSPERTGAGGPGLAQEAGLDCCPAPRDQQVRCSFCVVCVCESVCVRKCFLAWLINSR